VNDFTGAIGSLLQERPFSSCKVLYRHFRIGKVTCLRILRDKLGLKILSSLGAICLIDQPEERKSVSFEAPSDGADGTEGKQLSRNYHRD
jgi:hypothetical protein